LEFLFLLDHPRTVKLPVSVLPVSVLPVSVLSVSVLPVSGLSVSVLWHPKQTGASINSHMPFVLVQQ